MKAELEPIFIYLRIDFTASILKLLSSMISTGASRASSELLNELILLDILLFSIWDSEPSSGSKS